MIKKEKMNTKRLLVSFLLLTSLLFLCANISATSDLTNVSNSEVRVNDLVIYGTNAEVASVLSGETLEVKIKFTSLVNASNVRVRVDLDSVKDSVSEVTSLFDVEEGKTYQKTLEIKVPKDLDEEEVSNNLKLDIKIWNRDYESEIQNIELRVQKQSYELEIKSIITPSVLQTGESSPVDIVLKNVGYNDAKDIFVKVSVPELGIEKKAYLGDLVSLEDNGDDDKTNTVNAKIYLEIPFAVKSGDYTLTVSAENDETKATSTKKIYVENSVSDLIMRSGTDLVLLNPTSKLRVYKVLYNSNEIAVVLPATSSKVVPIETPQGDYDFDVTVLSGNTILGTFKFKGSNEVTQKADAVFILTVILGVVFLVLLVVLIVLITKKPQKTEDFGESYY